MILRQTGVSTYRLRQMLQNIFIGKASNQSLKLTPLSRAVLKLFVSLFILFLCEKWGQTLKAEYD